MRWPVSSSPQNGPATRRQKPVYLHSVAQGLPAQHHGMVNYWNDDPLTGPAWAAARQLWKQADFGPDDVDVAQIYDAFTPLIPLSLEGYGFCGRGEGAAFTEGGALESGAYCPSIRVAAGSARGTCTASTSSTRA